MAGRHSNEVEVELRPFKHQVGGHTCVLEVTRSTICKPFIPREAWFYENEPDELKDFTPKYLGETFVTCDIQEDRKCLVARVPEELVKRDGLSRSENLFDFAIQSTPNPKKRRKHSHSELRGSLETWSSICIDRQISRYGFWANNQPQKFIILENLVHDYEHPCLMDLKMGRRQFGEDSNEEKRKLLEVRCACSTSATLGFRISGSQVYKASTDNYTFHDKYFGRDLDRDGAIKELEQFFHNGVQLRADVIRMILVKLENLQSVLMSKADLFFHSASLLLIYDGGIPKSSSCLESSCDNVQYDNCNASRKCNLIEKGRKCNINGKDQKCTESSKESSTSEIPVSSKQDVHTVSVSATSCDTVSATSYDTVNATSYDTVTATNFDTDAGRAKFDVRLIDFAHVSERYTDDDEIENIADDTIVFGLIRLKEILTQLIGSF